MVYSLSSLEQEQLALLHKAFPLLARIEEDIIARGGRLLLVGGAVRNIMLSLPTHDLDVEVYHLSLEQLRSVLEKYGPVDLVGKSFGVLKLAGMDIDWALPRTDQSGRRPQVDIIPDLPIEQALKRRDLTMNAMGIDMRAGLLYDPFGGRADMAAGRLRTPDPDFFVQDPLRFYRVMQFIGRFGMEPDAELNELCRTIPIATLSHERIVAEFHKLLVLSEWPSRGLRWLERLGRLLEVLPELAATVGVLQEAEWHPEGDVFEHTMQAVDSAAHQQYVTASVRRLIIYAALCHDLGKAVATTVQEGKIRSKGHDEAGVPLAASLMKRISNDHKLQQQVVLLVRHHMMPGSLVKQKSSLAAYKRLAHRIAPLLTLRMLALLAYADKRGRNPVRGVPLTVPLPDIDCFVEQAEEAKVLDAPEPSVLVGEDLLPFVAQGPEMGKLLEQAYEWQINKGITDKKKLLEMLFPRCST